MTAFRRVCLAAVAAGLLAAAAPAHAQEPELFPLAQIARGQTGYGLSTFSGTEPERWEFEVIGVMENFRPKMSIILVKSDDPKMQTSGFWAGMSGSPLFIDGKLACAFSYGFQFNKKPIGGCTPLEYMIEEGLNAPTRAILGPTPGLPNARRSIAPAPASRHAWLAVAPGGSPSGALDRLGEPRRPWLLNAPLPPAPTVPSRPTDDPMSMIPAAVPLAISGLGGPAFQQAKALMAPYPVEPMQGGGTGNSEAGPTSFALGAPIAVQLARGDVGFAATGTVSFVQNQRVLAFGHPFFEQGEFYAPVAAAEVHTVIPSMANAYVLASPLRELGTLVQDRLPAIMADTRYRNHMIPMSVSIRAGQEGKRVQGTFNAELVHNRFLTASLAGLVAMNAVNRYLPDRDHATVRIDSRVDVKGHGSLQFSDFLYAGDGAASVIGGARGLRVLIPLLFNPYEPIEIERISLDIDLVFEPNYGQIEEIRLPADTLSPGSRSYVDVVMSTYEGRDVTQRVPFDVPATLAGSIVRLAVAPGDAVSIDVAPPENLEQLVAAFGQLLPGNVITVTLYTADPGVAIDGKLVRDLPASALDRFAVGSGTRRMTPYSAIARSSAPTSRVLEGAKALLVRIADEPFAP